MSGLQEFIIGDTMFVSWISSGQVASDIHFAVFNGSEDLVDSETMVTSGPVGGYVGAHTIPNTPGYYVVETDATIGSEPFVRRTRYQAICLEVD